VLVSAKPVGKAKKRKSSPAKKKKK